MTCIICGSAGEGQYRCSIGDLAVSLCEDHIRDMPACTKIQPT